MRLGFNPRNGRIYFCGGDFGGGGYKQSGRNDLWSYSIADSNWVLEYPYCGPAGQSQPSHPDEVGWAYDTSRDKFWMVPGYMGVEGDCPSPSATQVRGETMTFDPSSRTWLWPQLSPSPGSKYAVYDPVEDTIIQFIYNNGVRVGIYHIGSDTWEYRPFDGSFDMSDAQPAVDTVDRKAYFIGRVWANGVVETRLWRYDMDAKTTTIIDNTPPLINSSTPHMVWDSVNRVIILVDYEIYHDPSQATAWAYHPNSRTWEQLSLRLPEDGSLAYGNHLIYDPSQNVTLMIGGLVGDTPRYMFLYRYGPATADSIAPSTPANLRAR